MKIFLATSFSSRVDEAGNVFPEFRQQLERLINVFEEKGYSVFCAAREDGWQLNDIDPVEAFNKDIAALDQSDVIVALVGNNPPSAGVRLELGYAFAKNKKMLCFYDAAESFPYVDIGLSEQPGVTKVVYHSFEQILKDAASFAELLKEGPAI